MMSSPQPVGYCHECNAPYYWIVSRIQYTCLCEKPLAIGTIAIRRHIPDTEPLYRNVQQKPSHDVLNAKAADFEEVTPERAERIFQLLCKTVSREQASCSLCDAVAEQGYFCIDHDIMWMARYRWLKISLGLEKAS